MSNKPKVEYACTAVSCEREEDSYEEGCVGKRQQVFYDRVDYRADTFKDLLEQLRCTYLLELDDLFLPGGEDEETTNYIGFYRMENSKGDEPSEEELTEWREGKLKLYLADYSFSIERRTVGGIPVSEILESGISIH